MDDDGYKQRKFSPQRQEYGKGFFVIRLELKECLYLFLKVKMKSQSHSQAKGSVSSTPEGKSCAFHIRITEAEALHCTVNHGKYWTVSCYFVKKTFNIHSLPNVRYLTKLLSVKSM